MDGSFIVWGIVMYGLYVTMKRATAYLNEKPEIKNSAKDAVASKAVQLIKRWIK